MNIPVLYTCFPLCIEIPLVNNTLCNGVRVQRISFFHRFTGERRSGRAHKTDTAAFAAGNNAPALEKAYG